MTLPLNLALISKFDWRLLVSYDELSLAGSVALVCAAIPAMMCAVNFFFFLRPGRPWNKRVLPPVSVLIPARNKERTIAAAIEAVLVSRGVDLELIVLNDGSTDRTAEIVQEYADRDLRVRLESAPPVPEGWNGKQFACWQLASLAVHDVFCFLDANVRVGPEALYRMLSELNYVERNEPERALASGFPRQEMSSILERLLLPISHFELFGFLPLPGERWTRLTGFAAGCGQFMMVRREPYFACGGHSSIPTAMRDGLLLPRLFRRHGFRTSVFDLSRDAVCRMYSNAGEVWQGLAETATDGMASLSKLPVFTLLLLAGQVLPLPLAILAFQQKYVLPLRMAVLALVLGYGVRLLSVLRFRQSWLGALLHPLGVVVLLALQWYALLRKLAGIPVTWKQRAYSAR